MDTILLIAFVASIVSVLYGIILAVGVLKKSSGDFLLKPMPVSLKRLSTEFRGPSLLGFEVALSPDSLLSVLLYFL
ncbi:MAG: hypothetical protein HY226_03870 [Candidatus Vogelbacteria bacterium]|nr:hypothetical protein [Candidatus Vogelbacteria bacterium]